LKAEVNAQKRGVKSGAVRGQGWKDRQGGGEPIETGGAERGA